MNARFPISQSLLVLVLVVALPLAVAGCGNSGPLVMPDTVLAKTAPADAEADAGVDNPAVDTVEPDEVEAPVADPVPDVERDVDVDADDGND